MRRGLLLLLFVVSGAAALCYEVAWTRHLVLVFGNTTRAVALLLGAWMLGLALGSEVGGRLADRTRRPALLYAVFELAIAAFAFAFPWLVDAVRALYLGIGTSAPAVLFVLAFLLLVVPTFCMGTTLPLLARATVDDPARTGRDVGALYAANIVGAVIGAAGTGFLLMESQGVLGATRWAAAANAAVGIAGWLAFRGPVGTRPEPAAAPAPSPDDDAHARLRRAALVSAFSAGLVGLAAQVVWTRLLVFFLQGFTWTFTAILATFLTGLALGGWVFGRAASRSKDPARLLVRLHLGVAVASALALFMLGRHLGVTRALWGTAGWFADGLGARHRVMLVLASGMIVLAPSFLMGGCFPVATALYQRGLSDLGSRVGRLYAVNTAGCVLGSLATGFVLQPWLGPARTASVVAAVALAGAFAVWAVARVRDLRILGTLSPIAVLVLGWLAAPGTPFLLRSHVFAGAKARENALRSETHGEVCTVSVVDNTRERYRLLYTDEFEAAGTKPEYRYMRMLAHLPIALADDPSRTLVICFGTGTTSGSVAAHGAVRELDIVEISPEVLAAAPDFADVNAGVLDGRGRGDLAVRVHVDDGRHFVLRAGGERWGVITLEPLMPYTPAAIHFYTEDFYRVCAERLAPGGLMCQWIPLQGMDGANFRRLVAAFVAVYPESAMFFVDGAVALVGGPDGVKLSYARVAERLADPRVAADLRAIGFADPVRALATLVASGERLRTFASDVPPVTDERPVLEFHPIAPNVHLPWLGQNVAQMRDLRSGLDRLPVDTTGAGDPRRVEEDLFLALRSGNAVLEGSLALETSALMRRGGRPQEQWLGEFVVARTALTTAVGIDRRNETARRLADGVEREWWTMLGLDAMQREDLAASEKSLRRALEFRAQRQADVAWTLLAECLNRARRHEEALEAACEGVRLFPGGLDPRCERAFARAALGDVEGAASDYVVALRGEPSSALSPRLRADAERALAAFPAPVPPQEARGKVTERLFLRIEGADDAEAFRARHAGALETPSGDAPAADALRRIAELDRAAPEGAAETLAGWVVVARGRTGVLRPAAEALARLDAGRFADLLRTPPSVEAGRELARAAAQTGDRRVVAPLLELLASPDAETRKAAQISLFALLGAKAPGLGTLDTSDPEAHAYRQAVATLEAWWARTQDEAEVRRWTGPR